MLGSDVRHREALVHCAHRTENGPENSLILAKIDRKSVILAKFARHKERVEAKHTVDAALRPIFLPAQSGWNCLAGRRIEPFGRDFPGGSVAEKANFPPWDAMAVSIQGVGAIDHHGLNVTDVQFGMAFYLQRAGPQIPTRQSSSFSVVRVRR